MDQIVAIMLLVGCSGDGANCREIPVPAPSYASVADCQADLPLQLRFTSTYDDRVVGSCTGVEAAALTESATIEWALSRGGDLRVEIVPAEPQEVAQMTSDAETNLEVAVR